MMTTNPTTLPPRPTAWQTVRRAAKGRANLVIGAIMVVLLLLVGIFAPFIAPFDPLKQDLMNSMMPPSGEFYFGTDQYGRDIFSRVIFGVRYSLLEIGLGVGLAVLIGVPLGIFAGYFGGRVDRAIVWFADILFAFPGIVLAILIVSILGNGLINMLIAIAIFSIPVYTRLGRNLTLVLKDIEYAEAARALGAGHTRIMLKHILTNSLAPLMVQATLTAGSVILTAASLSFLGLGAQPPTPEWGAMVSNGRSFIGVATHMSLFPGLAITYTVLAFNILGDGLRDLLDPRFR